MATTTSSSFPLATLDPYTGSDGSSASSAPDDDAGASGGSSDKTFEVSTGALIAIIVVVVFVALAGSKSTAAPHMFLMLISRSCLGDTLLRRQEEGMEGPRDHPQIGKEGRHGPDPTSLRIPQVCEGRVDKVEEWPREDGRRTADAAAEAGGSGEGPCRKGKREALALQSEVEASCPRLRI